MLFAVSMIWHEPPNQVDNYYFFPLCVRIYGIIYVVKRKLCNATKNRFRDFNGNTRFGVP